MLSRHPHVTISESEGEALVERYQIIPYDIYIYIYTISFSLIYIHAYIHTYIAFMYVCDDFLYINNTYTLITLITLIYVHIHIQLITTRNQEKNHIFGFFVKDVC